VHTLDFAVMSYAGTHIADFDKEYFGAKHDEIKIPGPFWNLTDVKPPLTVTLRRRSMQCLDGFLHRHVWVFHLDFDLYFYPSGNIYYNSDNNSLYLSTDIRTFADIWGFYGNRFGNRSLKRYMNGTSEMGLLCHGR
jgi:hypothetical protein